MANERAARERRVCGMWGPNGQSVLVIEEAQAADGAAPEDGCWLCRDCGLVQPDTWSRGCDGCGAPNERLRWRRGLTMTAKQVLAWARARGLEGV